MSKTLLTTLALAVIAAGASVGYATVWDFNPNQLNAPVGATTETINGSVTGFAPLDPTTPQVTLSGFNANNTAHYLYFKEDGGDEDGIGFTNPNPDPSHELTLTSNGTKIANYMQIDVTQVLAAGGTNGMIEVGSTQLNSPGDQESFDVWGGSSANSLTHLLISGSTSDATFIPIPLDGGVYDPFYFVTVHPVTDPRYCSAHAGDNVLLEAVSFDLLPIIETPEPATLSLLALGGLAILRRRMAGR